MSKRALIIGNNYPDTDMPLKGCVNDAKAMKNLLEKYYGFKDVRLVLDKEATTVNMLAAMEDLVRGSKAGDILYFHYSGHGSQVSNKRGTDDEPDGLDEVLIPYDINWKDKLIRDDDLKVIFDKVPNGVNLTVSLDCCNSGSGLDQTNIYQPEVIRSEQEPKAEETPNYEFEWTNPVDNGAGRYLAPPPEAIAESAQRKLEFKKFRAVTNRNVNRTGLLLSASQAQQLSADAFLDGKYMGAFTFYLLESLAAYNYDVDYKTLIEDLNNRLAANRFSQRPELNGSASLFNYKFLEPMANVPVVETKEDNLVALQPVAKPEKVKPTPSKKKKDKNNKVPLIIGAVVAIAIAIFLATK